MNYSNLELKDIEGEAWRDIPGWEDLYMVSNKGRVKSLYREWRGFNNVCHKKEGILKQKVDKYGYMVVGLCRKGYKKYITVHRLVAISFIENERGLEQVNHINCGKRDNSVENLEWCTNVENNQHAIDNGRILVKGSHNNFSFLDESKVVRIRNLKKDSGLSYRILADMFGVQPACISKIITRRTWRHI